MTVLNVVRDEFNISLESFLEEAVCLQFAIDSLLKRMNDFVQPVAVTSDTVEMTVKGELKAYHFDAVMDIVRVSPGVKNVFLYVLRNEIDPNLRIVAGSGFHIGGSKVEDGVCYMQLRRYIRYEEQWVQKKIGCS